MLNDRWINNPWQKGRYSRPCTQSNRITALDGQSNEVGQTAHSFKQPESISITITVQYRDIDTCVSSPYTRLSAQM